MVILEIVAGGSPILQTAFSIQRAYLEQHAEVMSVDLVSLGRHGKKKVLTALSDITKHPDAILIRGVSSLGEILSALPKKAPVFVDHCTPVELGRTSPIKDALRGCRRVYCYSQRSDTEVRRAGTGKITIVSGPALLNDHTSTPNDEPIIAVLDLCQEALNVLARLLKIQRQQGWKFQVVTPLPHSKVIQVEDNFEAAELADFIIAPFEDKDFGQPHEGALLALALGKPLSTARTEAFNILGFPLRNFIPAKKHNIGTYAVSTGVYLRNRDKYDDWVEGAGPDPYALPRDLLSRI